jgi:hypothetical protein
MQAVTLVAAILAVTDSSAQQQPGSIVAVAAATEESTHWLESLDARRYTQSWADMAQVMRAGHNREDWVREVGTPREALGKPLMRELKSADYSTEVRGAPKGEYVTVVYLTQYSHAPPVQETVLMMMEDQSWHVAAYAVGLAPLPEAQSPAGGTAGDVGEPKTKQ